MTNNLTTENVSTTETTETTENVDKTFDDRLTELNTNLQNIITLCKSNIQENKTLKKEILKVNKQLAKSTRKKRNQNGGVKQLSGFAKPANISKDLAKFLGVTPDTKLARTDVTKRLNVYIKANKLQNEANKRIIEPDNKLGKLLGNGKDEVTYFNLQTYMKKHYPKIVIAQ